MDGCQLTYAADVAYADLAALVGRIRARDLPEPFLRAWDAFMQRYGSHGPNELDLASARYADNAMLVLEQLRQYVLLDESAPQSPQQSYDRRQRERRAAYDELLDKTRNPLSHGWWRGCTTPPVRSAGTARSTSTSS